MTEPGGAPGSPLSDQPVAAAVALGIGMGGFVDGIVFHQLLQVHHMLSARIATVDLAGVKVNMVWDGIFHAGVWAITALGIAMLWRAGARRSVRWSGRAFAGSLLLGWGLFNIVEGVIDHHILKLHHVYERAGASAWDWIFLGWGAAMILAALAGLRSSNRQEDGQRTL